MCEPCSDSVRFLPRQTGLTNTTVTVVDLLAHTNYTFEIDAVNGVSDLSTLSRQFAAVNITTNQAGESLSDYPFFVQNHWVVCTFVSFPCFTGVTLTTRVLGWLIDLNMLVKAKAETNPVCVAVKGPGSMAVMINSQSPLNSL